MPRTIVYISHPIRGDVANNIRSITRIMRSIHTEEIIPIAPYLGFIQYLDPTDPVERKLGESARELFFRRRAFDELWLYGDTVSKGMIDDIRLADDCGIHFIPKTPATLHAFAQYELERASREQS